MPELAQPLEVRVKAAQARIDVILKELNLKMGAIVKFPLYNRLPAEVQLALKVIERHEGEYRIGFQEDVKKGETENAVKP